ncbi:MAG: hypothetical protein OEM52_03205 [bacterium]|nr:hypothetical protein [bacterium]
MKWVLRVLPLLIAGLLLGSCDRNPTSNPGEGGLNPSVATSIVVTISNGPIQDFKNVQRSVPIRAVVTDSRGVAMSGVRVQFSKSHRLTTQASLTFANGDTTDTDGEVNGFLNVTVDTSETVTVSAQLANNSAIHNEAQVAVILATDVIRLLSLQATPSTRLVRQGSRDSITVVGRVTDNNGGGIIGIPLTFSIEPANAATLDSLEGTTNDRGEVTRIVRTNPGVYMDSIKVSCSVRGMPLTSTWAHQSVYVNVRPLTSPENISLNWINPENPVYVYPGNTVVQKMFEVVVSDGDGNELSGVPIALRIKQPGGIGSINQVTTSGNGRDSVTWSNNGEVGSAWIIGEIVPENMGASSLTGPIALPSAPGVNKSGSLPKSLAENIPLLGTDEVDALSDSIYVQVLNAPGVTTLDVEFTSGRNNLTATGVDSTEVRVTLRNGLREGIPNAAINLSVSYGAVPSEVFTDSRGIATTYLHDNSNTTPVGGAWLIARHRSSNLADSVMFNIQPLLRLARISMSGPERHLASAGDTLAYTATVYLSNGLLAYDGTVVTFSSFIRGTLNPGLGTFVPNVTTTTNGIANGTYRLGSGLGEDSLVVTAGSAADTVVSAFVILEHYTGTPSRFPLIGPSNLILSVNGDPSTVLVMVSDSVGNIVQNPTLTWGCTHGSITPFGYSTNGDTAYASLRAGTIASNSARWWVTTSNGVTDTVGYFIQASTPRTIALSTDSLQIQVRGTGGYENTTVRALVRDGNGNAVPEGVYVRFKITNSLNFGAVNNRPFFEQVGQDSIDVTTAGNGEALVTLSSGERPGTVQLEAVVLTSDPGHSRTNIAASLSNVQVVAGPAAFVDISWDRSTTQAEGGGQVSVLINARVSDRYSNPVANNTAVRFSVDPDSMASVNAASTGNLNASGTRVPGTAFSRMLYQSWNSFDTVRVTAYVDSRDTTGASVIVTGSAREHLPLHDGQIQLNVYPTTWHFVISGNRAMHTVYAIVQDGYGTRISRAPVVFSVQRGRIFSTPTAANQLPNGGTPMAPPRLRTGNYPGRMDPNGMGAATVYIGGTGPTTGAGEIFLDPQTLEITSEVTAYVEGYGAIQQGRVVINYQRN